MDRDVVRNVLWAIAFLHHFRNNLRRTAMETDTWDLSMDIDHLTLPFQYPIHTLRSISGLYLYQDVSSYTGP